MITNDGVYTDIISVEIEVTDSANCFEIMLDGKVRGGFQRIRIKPTIINSDHQLKLPLMSFFPISM